MKKSKRKAAKFTNAWAKVVPLSSIPKPYTGVVVHKGTAY